MGTERGFSFLKMGVMASLCRWEHTVEANNWRCGKEGGMGRGGEGFGLSSEDTRFFHGRRKAELAVSGARLGGQTGGLEPVRVLF